MATLFEQLPFKQAIDAFFNRLAVPKKQFLEWDAAARSRAFTMAYVRDTSVLESVFDELAQSIAEGKNYAQFEQAIKDNHLRGWEGTSAWHQRLVYEQNMAMAYSAGRIEQGVDAGLRAWRYLPSIADEPRAEHQEYYGNLYRFAAGSPVPPIDFNCGCGWEWVFPDELEALGLSVEDLPVFDPPAPKSGFVWSPSDYAALAVPGLNSASRLATVLAGERIAVCALQVTGTPDDVASWVDAATQAGGELAAGKLERLLAWMRDLAADGASLEEIKNRLVEARSVIASNEDTELDYLATFAAWLRGRVVTQEQFS